MGYGIVWYIIIVPEESFVFCPEDGDRRILINVHDTLQRCGAVHPRGW
jgi:hypothetical protein